jgi:hypothetical protein
VYATRGTCRARDLAQVLQHLLGASAAARGIGKAQSARYGAGARELRSAQGVAGCVVVLLSMLPAALLMP